jgi:DnaJ-like protein
MYFTDCHTTDEIKTRYRKLAMSLHPDKGGDPAVFRELQSQYEAQLKQTERQPDLPEIFKKGGNYTYLRAKVVYAGRDNHYYKFDKVGGAHIQIDINHMHLIKADFIGI